MAQVGMHEAKTTLSQLVERAEAGEEVIITRHGRPAARLVAMDTASAMAEAHGAMRGRVQIADDFDDLPPELRDAFGA